MAGRKTPNDKTTPSEAPETQSEPQTTPETDVTAQEGTPPEAAPKPAVVEDETPPAAENDPAEAEAAPDAAEGDGDQDPETEDATEEDPAPAGSEPEPEAKPESPAPAPAPAPVVVKRGPGFLPLVLGGVVAAGIGYGAAQYLPGYWPFAGTAEDGLKAQLDAQAKTLAELSKKVDAASGAAGGMGAQIDTVSNDLGARIDQQKKALSAEIETNKAAIADLGKQIANMPAPAPASGGAVPPDVANKLAALDKRVTALEASVQQRIDAAKQAAAAAEAQAAKAAQSAKARAAVTRIEAALTAGGPFAEPVSTLKSAGVNVPAALTGTAEAGVPTLATLQADFPPAARKALTASVREKVGGGVWGRVTAFLQVQTGARSVTPRAGDGPDAVLSRAQAAMDKGDLSAAIETIKALPEAGQKAMAPWVAEAETRLKATSAAKDLAAGLDGK